MQEQKSRQPAGGKSSFSPNALDEIPLHKGGIFMSYFIDAKELIKHAKTELTCIKEAYDQSLKSQEIKSTLLIRIKNFMENLRSSLDFTARGLFFKYGSSNRNNPNIYFPYATLNQTKAEFERVNRIEVCIPGLTATRPDIAEAIMDMQHFASANNRWLPIFMELNNKNKHQQLTPQTRKEFKELRIISGERSISIREGTKVTIGKGVKVTLDGKTFIKDGQTFDVNNPPTIYGPGEIKVFIWVSFTFSHNGEPVLPLLKQSLAGAETIIDTLSAM